MSLSRRLIGSKQGSLGCREARPTNLKIRNEEAAQRVSLGAGYPRMSMRISRGRPGATDLVRPSKSWKNKHFGADVHDPKARTSTTPGGFKKLRSEKLRAEVPFPREGGSFFTSSLELSYCIHLEDCSLLN